MNQKLEIASRILAGLVSNPAVIATNPMQGFKLVNCTESQIAQYAVALADELFKADLALSGYPSQNYK